MSVKDIARISGIAALMGVAGYTASSAHYIICAIALGAVAGVIANLARTTK